MVKPYFCEYCNRKFKGDVRTRKLHLQSQAHRTAYAAYYAQFEEYRREEMNEQRPSSFAGKLRRLLTHTAQCMFSKRVCFSEKQAENLNWNMTLTSGQFRCECVVLDCTNEKIANKIELTESFAKNFRTSPSFPSQGDVSTIAGSWAPFTGAVDPRPYESSLKAQCTRKIHI
ncbi:putative zinc finger matrin-type protein 5 [Trichinella spiralis]|uniref:putative zinc finger matrin-type protein 5 n=1 Tax=Trichinella spiralis TaxID=6334 RepID=UPI0001EFB258|nr:putative zinc finger matrin-type protein 5 [Trichinella spiralis]